jgi:hypothetical protein
MMPEENKTHVNTNVIKHRDVALESEDPFGLHTESFIKLMNEEKQN